MPAEHLERVGELDLAAPPRRGLAEHIEYFGVAHVPPDDDPPARRRSGDRLFHQVGDHHHVVVAGRRDRGAAVQGHLFGVDLHQRHDAAAELLADVDHPGQQRVARVDEVVAEQHRERLVPDVLRGAQDRVAKALRVPLPDVVHGGEIAGLADQGQLVPVLLGGQRFLEFIRAVEVVLDASACCAP